MNLFTKIRDIFDATLYSVTAICVQNKKIIRALTITTVIFSLVLLLSPSWQKDLGSLSWALLLAILFLSPLAKISQSKALNSLMLFRREAGILMGVFAIEHTLLYFVKFGVSFNAIFTANFWIKNSNLTYIGWGTLALIITLPLLLTSNNLSMRLLRINWKRLQCLAYLLLILVTLHIAFIKYNFAKAFVITIIYIVLKILALTGFQLPATINLTPVK